ncbi:MarR family winged helix-turn-helix transcriptional regulator [Nocardioides sp. S-58]|uniref:MarR family winged helix-turn-helix transcriptional regulator n=1 Tax=Nocardioides renjunii TaxID=3095075 RepID=A0ABU5KB77_9ACTN|nr:MarR family winged helix-turn-helix transcriptional regulator [Nocardioides sp. S-58]MDZ5662208.1 MarR family winged helix-turn-helix transcriptional regulator [Nocardioides sp. S-58]
MTTPRQRHELGVLLFVANRALEQRAFDAVAAAGITDITLAQARIAARIAPDGSRVSDLAEQARVTKQSAASLVEQLERAGYVERVPDPTDGRARLVRLTARLQRVAEVADAEVEDVLSEWADRVGEDRLEQLHEILRDLREVTDPWWHA